MWNPLGIVGVITAFNFPCAVLGEYLSKTSKFLYYKVSDSRGLKFFHIWLTKFFFYQFFVYFEVLMLSFGV